MAASSRTMRAVQYDKYGGGAEGLKHVEAPMPSPKKGEVLIRMEAASINPADWKIQNGVGRPFMPRKFPFIPGWRRARRVRGGTGVAHGGEAAGGVRSRGRLPADRRGHRAPIAEGSRGQLRRRRPQERAGHGGLRRRRPLRRAARQAGGAPRHGHLRRAQRWPRPEPRRRRGAGLRHPGRRRAAEPVWQEVRRGGALRDGVPVVHVRDGSRRRRRGCGHHAGRRGRRHHAPPEGDLLQEEAGAAPYVAQEGGDGALGGHGEAGEAQGGDRLEVPAEQSAGGLGQEHGRPRHRQGRRGNGRRRVSTTQTVRTYGLVMNELQLFPACDTRKKDATINCCFLYNRREKSLLISASKIHIA